MTDEKNDMIPADPGKKLPASLDGNLRSVIPEKDLDRFREQLPTEFLSDATEGLDHLKDNMQLESVLQQLNYQMHQHLAHKKVHKRRRPVGNSSWTYWAILMVILLTIVGFVIVRMLLHH